MKPIVLNSGVIYLNELDSDTILDAIDDLEVSHDELIKFNVEKAKSGKSSKEFVFDRIFKDSKQSKECKCVGGVYCDTCYFPEA